VLGFFLAVGVSLAPLNAARSAPVGVTTYDGTVAGRIRPQEERLLVRLADEGRAMKIDGVTVFNGDDKFLPGKIAMGYADVIVGLPKDDPRLQVYLADFRKIARLTVEDDNDTWGIYYYMSALNRLREQGELDAAVDPETLARLRTRLDWRTFVRTSDWTLIDLPNNYYGVAFSIARLRTLMGWEDGSGAQKLLNKALDHYRRYSGPYGFADETDGDGRFDRYSVLLSAELTQRFLETGSKPPPEVLGWLRKSADLMLLRLNDRGEGFEYGRSLGPYADTSVIEVLTAAAVTGVLTPRERDVAYAFICRAGVRYADFWTNSATGSVDLWDQGRRTDAYRGKFRILGENLSLAHQFAYTDAAWNAMGYRGSAPMAGYDAALARLPGEEVTWFARGQYDRVLLTLRDRGRVIGLPLISGASGQHMHNPYFPIPYSPDMLAGVADASWPQLLPRFTLADGSVLEPLAYFNDVNVRHEGARTVLTYRQTLMDRMGKSAPVPDDRLSATVTYELSPGRITRTEVYAPRGPIEVKALETEFASYSSGPEQRGDEVRFAHGAIASFKASGFGECHVGPVADAADYRTPVGPFLTRVACSRGPMRLSAPLTLSWTLTYH
jgi:hypothetical protein